MTDRDTLRTWLADTGWNILHLLRGVRCVSGNNVPSEQAVQAWLKGDRLPVKHLSAVMRFVRDYPEPGLYADWMGEIAARAHAAVIDEERALEARKDKVWSDRQQRIARLLAEERRPRERGTWWPSQRWT